MTRATRRAKKPADEHTLLGARITGYEVRITAERNVVLKLADRREADPRDPLYTYITTLQVEGECTYPDAADLRLTLEDIHARDSSGTPQYRPYRGEDVPVYEPPPGITVMSRGRQPRTWQTYLPVAPRLASDMLTALATGAAPFSS